MAINRREFLKSNAIAALGALGITGSFSAIGAQSTPKSKSRLVIVGTGMRGITMWGTGVVKNYADYVEMVGLCDINPKRVDFARTQIGENIPTFTDFDEMIRCTRPDKVIVATVDCFHAQYVIRAMELGCDVICEKPFGTDEQQCQAMYDAEKKLGRNIIVTFNARYMPSESKVKELLLAGEIGDVYSIDYNEFLDLDHGASYYRRWHGFKKFNGTLLVTKGGHHFDHINWWLGCDPVEVMAYGDLKKYGRNGPFRHTHCRTCPHKSQCKFYWDITKDDFLMKLYVNCESQDGYLRDGCLYREDLDTYDTNAVIVKYANNVMVTYSLVATAPYEGQRIVINGSKGRIEVRNYLSQPWDVPHRSEIRLTRNFKDSVLIYPDYPQGGHGGADDMLKDHLFIPQTKDELGYRAGSRAGIMSSLVGIAAYKSIESGHQIQIKDLINFG